VLDLFAMGRTTAQIAPELGHALQTIQKHLLLARRAGDSRALRNYVIVRKHGPNPNKHWTAEDDAKLRRGLINAQPQPY
jgi:predicted transcriptional regulator